MASKRKEKIKNFKRECIKNKLEYFNSLLNKNKLLPYII